MIPIGIIITILVICIIIMGISLFLYIKAILKENKLSNPGKRNKEESLGNDIPIKGGFTEYKD